MNTLENYSNVLKRKGAILSPLFYKKSLATIREHFGYTEMRGIFFVNIEFLCILFTSEGIYNIVLFLHIRARYVPYPLYLLHLIHGLLLPDDLMLNYSEE
jgi:hypothetical protein